MKIYAMSDMHGCIEEFEKSLSLVDLDSDDTMLVLLGDYIHGHDSYAVLDRVMGLEQKYGRDKIVALMGNHEEAVLFGDDKISDYDDVDRPDRDDDIYLKWMKKLRLYYRTEKQIFVHAGIDETAGEDWEYGTPDHFFTGKYPPTTGKFYMDIISGHTGTAAITGDEDYYDIYYDGKSHYFIDGSVLKGGRIPVLMVDTDAQKYYSVSAEGGAPYLMEDLNEKWFVRTEKHAFPDP